MLAFIRILLIALWILPCLFVTLILCLLRPFHSDNIYFFATIWGPISGKILNVDVELRNPENLSITRPCVFISNHQSNFDLFLASIYRMRGAVSLGKKEILFFPFFGLFYWLSGNITVDRGNRKKSIASMKRVKEIVLRKKLAILIMPEGTRSHGKGLGPFKKGAFHTAREINVPIIPICVSPWHKNINLNRFKSGRVIIDVLPPIMPSIFVDKDLNEVINNIRSLVQEKINSLDSELNS